MSNAKKIDRVELLAAICSQYPDIAARMTVAEILNWLRASPWLAGFAGYNHLDLELVVRANCVFRYERGIAFEKQHGGPASDDDWIASYYDDANLFAAQLSCNWVFNEHGRLNGDLGGPF